MPLVASWRKATLFLAVLALLLLPSLGFAYFGMDSMGAQGNCPFMPGHSMVLCQSNPLEHVQELQGMFIALPAPDTFLVAFLLMYLLALAVAILIRQLLSPPLSLVPIGTFSSWYYFPRSTLQEAYARGILNTKAF